MRDPLGNIFRKYWIEGDTWAVSEEKFEYYEPLFQACIKHILGQSNIVVTDIYHRNVELNQLDQVAFYVGRNPQSVRLSYFRDDHVLDNTDYLPLDTTDITDAFKTIVIDNYKKTRS